METRRRKQRAELGSLLTDAEADELLNLGRDQPGGKSFGVGVGLGAGGGQGEG